MISLLQGRSLTARQISAQVGIPEKEVCAHLPHVRKSAERSGGRFQVTPAECNRCGYSFRKRDRMEKPSRCPLCRGESITEPLFSVEAG